jgi:hypothetical protein
MIAMRSSTSGRFMGALLFALLWAAVIAPVRGATPPPASSAQAEDLAASKLELATTLLTTGLSKPALPLDDAAKELLNELLHSPETANKANALLNNQTPGWAFLQDVNFKFKAFQADTPGAQTSLGFSYELDRSFAAGELKCTACKRGLDLSLHAEGNVAFDKDVNPNDFLETRMSFSLFQSMGGFSAPSDADSERFNQISLDAARLRRADDPKKYDDLIDEALAIADAHFTTQYYVEASANAQLESNQTFSKKQYVYAARLMGEVKPWGSLDATSFADLDNWSKFNVLDYPFALLRVLTGFEECGCFLPRGLSLPSVSVAIGTVDPQDGDPRSALAGVGSGSYTRLDAEASFKTPVARISGNTVSLSMSYRLFDELNAASAVSAAGLGRYDYFVASLGTGKGPFISYTSGQLPFELRSDKVYEIGFQTYLK